MAWLGFFPAIQLEETDRRWLIDLHAVMSGDEPQRVIDVRQMIDGHVADETAFDGGITQTPMQPAKENAQLRNEREGADQPIRVHECGPQTRLAAGS